MNADLKKKKESYEPSVARASAINTPFAPPPVTNAIAPVEMYVCMRSSCGKWCVTASGTGDGWYYTAIRRSPRAKASFARLQVKLFRAVNYSHQQWHRCSVPPATLPIICHHTHKCQRLLLPHRHSQQKPCFCDGLTRIAMFHLTNFHTIPIHHPKGCPLPTSCFI